MTNYHRIDFTMDHGGYVTAKITCTAPHGSPCRLWCDEEDCEEGTSPDHAHHSKRDRGYCLKTTGWFDDDTFILEQYEGPDVPLVPGPVNLSWDGDGMAWSFDV